MSFEQGGFDNRFCFGPTILSIRFRQYDKIRKPGTVGDVAANICDRFVMLTAVGTVYFADKNALKGKRK